MRSGSVMKTLAALCVALGLLMCFSPAQAGLFNGLPEVIVLQPGKDVSRQFYLNDVFELEGFHNYQSFFWIALADTLAKPEVDPGVLTITMSTAASSTPNFGTYIKYSLSGASYFQGATIDQNLVYLLPYTTPQGGTKAITMNAKYGFGYVLAWETEIEGVVVQPTPWTIKFSLAAKK